MLLILRDRRNIHIYNIKDDKNKKYKCCDVRVEIGGLEEETEYFFS